MVRAVFGYAGAHEFERKDFLVFVHKITNERTVQLAPPAEARVEGTREGVRLLSTEARVCEGRGILGEYIKRTLLTNLLFLYTLSR
jgi:hypothetical protein